MMMMMMMLAVFGVCYWWDYFVEWFNVCCYVSIRETTQWCGVEYC